MDWKEVEERLVEALRLWWRSPGGAPGSSGGLAADGPWHLLTREVRAGGKWEAWRQLHDESRGRRLPEPPPSAADISRRDEASAWLAMVPERERWLVVAVVTMIAAGRRPDWGKALELGGIAHGKNGLRMRYQRAMTALAGAVSASQRRRAA
jgi:hypothetical protein